MKTFTATPEEFATGQAASKAHALFKYRNWKVKPWERPKRGPLPKPKKLDAQIGTITPEQFGRGDAYWAGKRRFGHRQQKSDVIKPLESLDEARLPDLLLDLADLYGNAFPRPRGNVIQFTVVDENTTYEKAKAKIEGVLNEHGLLASGLTITPGPEQRKPFNRQIVILLGRDTLL